MDKNRSRYELHRKYLRKSSTEDSTLVSGSFAVNRITSSYLEVTQTENVEVDDAPAPKNQDTTNSMSTLRSRFHNNPSLPDLAVSQLDKCPPRSIPLSNPPLGELTDDIIQTKSSFVLVEESIDKQSDIDQQSQETYDKRPPFIVETKTSSTVDESQVDEGAVPPISALHRRFSGSTALSPARLDSKPYVEVKKIDSSESPHDLLDSIKSIHSPPMIPSDRGIPVHLHHVKPRSIQHDREQSISSLTAFDTTTTTSDSANSSSLLTTRNEPSAMFVSNASGIYRPTEAQLRWSQYHRKERAMKTQLYIEKLMKTPLLPNNVSGVISGDDDSYTSYEDVEGHDHLIDIVNENYTQRHLLNRKKKALGFAKKAKNKNIPNLSVGRRVLLRVSARLTNERRLIIREHGYEMEPDSDDGIEMSAIHDRSRIDKQHSNEDEIGTNRVKDGMSNSSPLLQSGQMSLPGTIIGLTVNANKARRSRKKSGTLHLKGRKSIVNTADENEDRIKRFEAAYSALLNTVLSMQHAATTAIDDIDRENMKRWSRASHITPSISIDGREYYDLQRAPSIRYEKARNQTLYELIDRGASWLMHLPKQEKINFLSKILAENKPDVISGESQLDNISNLGQERLLELIEQLQLYSETRVIKSVQKNLPENSLDDIYYMSPFISRDGVGNLRVDEDMAVPITPTELNDQTQESSNNRLFSSNISSLITSEVDTDSTSPMTASKSKNLPPIYRGPIIRQGPSPNLRPDSEVLMRISAWRSGHESIDTNDVQTSIEIEDEVLNPGDVIFAKDSCSAPSVDETFDPLPTNLIPELQQALNNYSNLEQTVILKINDWCHDESAGDENNEYNALNQQGNPDGELASKSDNNVEVTDLDGEVTSTSDKNFGGSDSGVETTSTSDKNFEVSVSNDERASSSCNNSELSYDEYPSGDDALLDDIEASLRFSHTFIDTDQASDVSDSAAREDRMIIGNLMLTPEILNKRLYQAVSSIQVRSWEQVLYLLSANPWLAEMMDMVSKQYLLHQLSLHGASEEAESKSAAPEDLNELLIQMFPHAAQKLDRDGNLPIHYAAMSLNDDMVSRLLQRFPSGLSVQNVSGHLPLHLSIIAAAESSLADQAISCIGYLLNTFPDAMTVQDYDGNLPLHLAASFLTGETAIGILSMMLAKIDKETILVRLPKKRYKKNLEKILSEDLASLDCMEYSEPEEGDDSISTLCIKNRRGHSPIMCAIRSSCDWDIIRIFLGSKQCDDAVLSVRENGKTILQMAIESCCDPPTILSIIKLAPLLVRIRDENGILPIEAICARRDIPSKIIAAMVLVDLPTSEASAEGSIASYNTARDYQGASWWWINCECDDIHVNIVREILSMSSPHHKRQLCSVQGKSGASIMVCATPKCKKELQKAQRFAGRFELLREIHHVMETSNGIKLFEAFDFRDDDELGTRVLLKCYSHQYNYVNDAFLFDGKTLNYDLVEENEAFVLDDSPHRFLIASEYPSQSLSSFIQDRKPSMDYDQAREKNISILLKIGESINHLHQNGIVHGAVSIMSVGRFGKNWKLTNLAGSRRIQSTFSPLRMGLAAPPEAVDRVASIDGLRYAFRSEVMATPAIDIWAFGKLSYELLSGHQFIHFNTQQNFAKFLAHWSDESLLNIINDLDKSPAGSLAADLISRCLSPYPHDRPRSMKEVMSHSLWQ